MSKIGIIKIKNIFARLFVSIKLRKHQPKTGLGIFTTKGWLGRVDSARRLGIKI